MCREAKAVASESPKSHDEIQAKEFAHLLHQCRHQEE